ncbi:MAG TPA: hydrogen peroxide-inducible genes activator [Gammaproteobacteria bacterium]|nr:hydrogen peroxide-inducible genes activator [Gammaproteobacteria bacterium]
MTLTELRYIIAVAQHKHFGRAAAACFVSQPTLSVAIKKLEGELDISLFERANHEVRITDIGEKIIIQAKRALEEVEQIKQIASQGKDQLHGTLRVGAIYTIGPYLYPELIPQLKELAPDMPLVIEENFTHVLKEKLQNGELDIIIIALPFAGHGLLTSSIYDEPFVALLPASHPLNMKQELQLADMQSDEMILLGHGHCFRDQVIDACPSCANTNNINTQSILQGSSLETLRHMVASGMGITMLPCTAAGADRYSQRLLKIRRFATHAPQRTVAIAWRSSFTRPEVIDAIRNAIKQCAFSCVHMT